MYYTFKTLILFPTATNHIYTPPPLHQMFAASHDFLSLNLSRFISFTFSLSVMLLMVMIMTVITKNSFCYNIKLHFCITCCTDLDFTTFMVHYKLWTRHCHLNHLITKPHINIFIVFRMDCCLECKKIPCILLLLQKQCMQSPFCFKYQINYEYELKTHF